MAIAWAVSQIVLSFLDNSEKFGWSIIVQDCITMNKPEGGQRLGVGMSIFQLKLK